MEWILYLMVFVFGYFTCKTFYFLRATAASIGLIKLGQIISLSITAKALEDYHAAKVNRMQAMMEGGESERNIQAFSYRFEDEIRSYKKKSIAYIIAQHPDVFRQIVDFEDWETAMLYLNANKETLYKFLTREER